MRTIGKFVTNAIASKKLWRILLIPMVLGSAFLAFTLYHNSAGVDNTSNITVLSQGNAQQVQTELQSWNKPVFFEVCAGDDCNAIDPALNAVAGKYKGQILFIQVNPSDVPQLAQQAASVAGITAYPTSLLTVGSASYAKVGVLSESDINTFISSHTSTTNVISMDSSNEQQVMQALQSAKTNVLFVVGTTDILQMEDSAIQTEAKKYADNLIIVEATPDTQLAQSIAQSMGAQVFPVWAFENTQGGQLVVPTTVGSASALDQLIQAGLKAKPQSTPSTGTGTGATGTTGSGTSTGTTGSGTSTATPSTGK
jgi:thiol-disulfide isomerase/thioredoxin